MLLALALGSAVDTHADACRKAADRYEIAVAEVVDAVRAYEKCVSASRARDACTRPPSRIMGAAAADSAARFDRRPLSKRIALKKSGLK